MTKIPIRLAAAVAAATALTMATPAGAPAATPPQPAAAAASALPGPPPAQPGQMQPLWRTAGQSPAQGVTPDTIGEPGGYDPAELRAYLGLEGTGQGQTVVVMGAFNVGTSVTQSLAAFDATYGLKPACSDTVTSGCFHLTITAPQGIRPIDDTDAFVEAFQWQPEADLDVAMVHAIAPDADITVVEAFDSFDTSLRAAVEYAESLHPAAISNSYGEPEFDGEHAFDSQCPATGSPCVFASGDTGNPGMYPAASPDVIAVGGTTLDMGPTGQVRSEIAWLGSGGGISPFEPQPAYQSAADPFPGGRGVPDVSFDADPNSGVPVYIVQDVPEFAFHNELWQEFGGTSMGAPAWAAILAVADQLRAAKDEPPLTTEQLHAALYSRNVKALADITTGGNGICGPVCTAGPGYDLVTGQGSPRPGIDTYLARH